MLVDVQRVGPSTGQPTATSQGDVMQARWGTHGDHPMIALAPWTVRETFDATVMAVNYAERFRTPVILLMDETVGHLRENVELPDGDEIYVYPRRKPKKTRAEGYEPYAPDTDLVPNVADFGHGYHIHVTGLIHDETGFPSGSPDVTTASIDRLHQKIEIARDEITHFDEFFMDDAEYAVVSFGGSARTIWPFADKEISSAAEKVKGLLVPELNYGQLVHEVERAAAGKCAVKSLTKYNKEIFTPEEIVSALNDLTGGAR